MSSLYDQSKNKDLSEGLNANIGLPGSQQLKPPVNAGNMGLIPSPWRSHIPQEQLSPGAAGTTEAQVPRAQSQHDQKPKHPK